MSRKWSVHFNGFTDQKLTSPPSAENEWIVPFHAHYNKRYYRLRGFPPNVNGILITGERAKASLAIQSNIRWFLGTISSMPHSQLPHMTATSHSGKKCCGDTKCDANFIVSVFGIIPGNGRFSPVLANPHCPEARTAVKCVREALLCLVPIESGARHRRNFCVCPQKLTYARGANLTCEWQQHWDALLEINRIDQTKCACWKKISSKWAPKHQTLHEKHAQSGLEWEVQKRNLMRP